MFTFDGRNLKSTPYAQAFLQGLNPGRANAAVVAGMTEMSAYKTVPWLYRAVVLRANNVSRFPFSLMQGDKDVTEDAAFDSLLKGIRDRLWRTEASLALTGRAYWYKAANAAGRNVTPQFLLPFAVNPVATGNGLSYFNYASIFTPDIPSLIPLERMVWFWRPNLESDILPGPADATVALAAASMLHALDTFTAQFFNQGAVKVTVFPVPTGTQQSEIDKFENFLARRVSGVRNALRNIVMRLNDKLVPIVIGSDIKDTEAPELTKLQRDNVAAAMGVPASVIDGKSSDDSNSRSEKLAFVVDTIIPEVELIFERANEQLFSQFNPPLELVAHPEQLEIMQSQQLDQAAAVMELVGKPVLLDHEGRALLGYPPIEQAEKLYDEELAALGLVRKDAAVPPMPAAPGVTTGGMTPVDDAMPEMAVVKAVEEVVHPGAMLAFMLSPDESALLGSIGGYIPDHLTLLYLGKDASAIDSSKMAALVTVLAAFAKRCAPFYATVSGTGRFESDEGDGTNAVYASIDSPSLPGFREELLRLVRSVGIEPASNHGFTPHVTLGYVGAMMPTPAVALPVMRLNFGTVTLVAAGNYSNFQLTGMTQFKALEGDHEQVTKALGEWRKKAMDALRNGDMAVLGTPFGRYSVVPPELLGHIYEDLKSAGTPAAVRAVFTKHWPKPAATPDPMTLATLELKRFNDHLARAS